MSSVRRIDDDEPAESSYQLRVLEMDDGAKALYDTDNPDAWLQTDEQHILDMDGRWR